MKTNYKWLVITAIGGVIMIFGISSGLRILTLIFNLYINFAEVYVYEYIGSGIGNFISFIILILFYIIAGGGISVILGCLLILIHLHRLGRRIIALGAGIGAVGMFLYILYMASFTDFIDYGSEIALLQLLLYALITLADPYFFGALLTIIGRKKIKSFEKQLRQEKKEQLSLAQESQNYQVRTIICSVCGISNPEENKFCKHCGNYLDRSYSGEGRRISINY